MTEPERKQECEVGDQFWPQLDDQTYQDPPCPRTASGRYRHPVQTGGTWRQRCEPHLGWLSKRVDFEIERFT